MGLPISVTVRGSRARSDEADRAVQDAFAELRHVDRVFSTYRADSEISLIRRGALPRELASPLVREVLELCAQARALTDGCFDVDLPQPDGRRLLDPSGLVKGWAVERAASSLDRLGEADWLINAGGDVLGRATNGPAWRVAIEDPQDRTSILRVLPLQHGAVATSGSAARGEHITDPRTRRLARGLLSATVVGPSLTWADVLATAAYVEGPAALDRIEALDGYEAVLVTSSGRQLGTRGIPHEPAPTPPLPRREGERDSLRRSRAGLSHDVDSTRQVPAEAGVRQSGRSREPPAKTETRRAQAWGL